jgi:tetratricopeptide (TPR) repeat protein
MRSAVELEASTEKHNITPGPIVTARELYADMLMEVGQPGPAAQAYEASLRVAPNRFKALHGAGRAFERAGDRDKAKTYYAKLLITAASADTERPELREAKAFR